MDEIWLPLSPETSIAVKKDEAFTMTAAQFAGLYMNHVAGAPENEAMAWADRMVEERNEALYLDWYMGDNVFKDYWPEEFKNAEDLGDPLF